MKPKNNHPHKDKHKKKIISVAVFALLALTVMVPTTFAQTTSPAISQLQAQSTAKGLSSQNQPKNVRSFKNTGVRPSKSDANKKVKDLIKVGKTTAAIQKINTSDVSQDIKTKQIKKIQKRQKRLIDKGGESSITLPSAEDPEN